MFDLGQESTIQVGQKTYRVGKFSISVLEKLMAWIRDRTPDPFAGLEKLLPFLPPDEAKLEVRKAQAARQALDEMDIDSPIVARAVDSNLGRIYTFLFMLQKHHPEATVDTVQEIMEAVGAEKIAEAMAKSKGVVSGGNAEAPSSGRATGLTGKESGSSFCTDLSGVTLLRKSAS